MKPPRLLWLLVAACSALVAAQPPAPSGTITGSVVEPGPQKPVEYATVALRGEADGQPLRTGATDAKGEFAFEDVPFGSYIVAYGLVGEALVATPPITLSAAQPAANLGRLTLGASEPAKLDAVEVTARREAFYNAIDRKVYNVGQDVRSVTGSASDLLQNVPSVHVDVEGAVSLRGDSNVLILVNGKSSALMGRNRAAALEQMPADRIERIEVITNPSAKFKPDGTAGIINLVLKKQKEPGYAATLRGAAGNGRRYNASVLANFNPGPWGFTGSAALRQDDRERVGRELRTPRDGTGAGVTTERRTIERSRPLTHLAELGANYRPGEKTTLGASVVLTRREFDRDFEQTNLSRDPAGRVTGDYDRLGTGPEIEHEREATLKFEHAFPGEDRELNVELRLENDTETQDTRYAHSHRTPARAVPLERTELKVADRQVELSAEYKHPLADDAKLEAGYNVQREENDIDFRVSTPDATGAWLIDRAVTNRFVYESTLHALYATFGRPLGDFGFLTGLRFEHADTRSHQVTSGVRATKDYARLYPSLHLTYKLSEPQQLQLNYSHRVNRPDGDELNPYPHAQDPLNVHTGNPQLVPEDIHSLEAGWQYRKDDTTYLASVYHRQRYHGITDVTQLLAGNVLLTRPENLATSRSGGLELGATTRLRERLGLNFSANVYRQEIDARNLGFGGTRTAFAWDAKLNANWDVTKSFLLQATTSYTARRLTPQGERRPSHFVNLGARYNFKDRKTAAVVTVSDAFASQRDRTLIDTAALHNEITRRRGGRVFFLGVIHRFGKVGKNPKDEIQFDNAL